MPVVLKKIYIDFNLVICSFEFIATIDEGHKVAPPHLRKPFSTDRDDISRTTVVVARLFQNEIPSVSRYADCVS